eukprot:382525_1
MRKYINLFRVQKRDCRNVLNLSERILHPKCVTALQTFRNSYNDPTNTMFSISIQRKQFIHSAITKDINNISLYTPFWGKLLNSDNVNIAVNDRVFFPCKSIFIANKPVEFKKSISIDFATIKNVAAFIHCKSLKIKADNNGYSVSESPVYLMNVWITSCKLASQKYTFNQTYTNNRSFIYKYLCDNKVATVLFPLLIPINNNSKQNIKIQHNNNINNKKRSVNALIESLNETKSQSNDNMDIKRRKLNNHKPFGVSVIDDHKNVDDEKNVEANINSYHSLLDTNDLKLLSELNCNGILSFNDTAQCASILSSISNSLKISVEMYWRRPDSKVELINTKNKQFVAKVHQLEHQNKLYKNKICHLSLISTALRDQMINGPNPKLQYINHCNPKCKDYIERTQQVADWKKELNNKYKNKLISKHNESIPKTEQTEMKQFLDINKNDGQYINPITTHTINNEHIKLQDTVEKFTIKLPHRVPALNGENGVKAQMDIPENTILARYIGYEMTNEEWNDCYDYSNKDMLHSQYLFTFDIDENKAVTIDPLHGKKHKLLVLYINDCRKDIFCEILTDDDKTYQNCKFVVSKINGWPNVFIITTKQILKGNELYLDYGNYYCNCIKQNNRWSKIVQEVRNNADKNILNGFKLYSKHNDVECHDLTD